MTVDSTIRQRALTVLRLGLATAAEIATALGISRQAVQQWANKAGIDPVTRRAVTVRKLLRRK